MSIPVIKLKVRRKSVLKGKSLVKFPANVTAESPILLARTGGNYDFSFDVNAFLASLNLGSIYIPLAQVVQIVTTSSDTILPATTLLVVERASPTLTTLALPAGGDPRPDLRILDWSTSITADHEIRLTPQGTNTVMKAGTWSIYSNAAQLGSVSLKFSSTLNGWYITP